MGVYSVKEADGRYTCMFIKNCPNGVNYLLPMLNLTDDSESEQAVLIKLPEQVAVGEDYNTHPFSLQMLAASCEISGSFTYKVGETGTFGSGTYGCQNNPGF